MFVNFPFRSPFIGLCFFAMTLLSCQNTSSPEQDEDAIQTNIKSYADAYNRHDAKALAAHWAENGVYINPESGHQINGRAAIQREFEKLFENPGDSKMELTINSIEFSGKDRAIERGTTKILEPNKAPSVSEYMAIHVKIGNRWYIESVAETDLNDTLSTNEQLRELGWMIGKWIDKDDTVQIETECQWILNHRFIDCNFKVSFEGKENFSGKQLIGWDPDKMQIRSWIYDSDGGYGEGLWSRDDHKWIVHVTSVLPDGRKGSAVNVYTVIDANSYKFHSSGREVSGQILPNIKEVSIIRTRAQQ